MIATALHHLHCITLSYYTTLFGFHFTSHNYPTVFGFHFTSLHLTTLTDGFSSLGCPLMHSVITFLSLSLKVDGLQGRVSNTSAGNRFQSPMVLFTNEYFPISVLCLLVLILSTWSTLLVTCNRKYQIFIEWSWESAPRVPSATFHLYLEKACPLNCGFVTTICITSVGHNKTEPLCTLTLRTAYLLLTL